MYKLLKQAAIETPVQGNQDGSYLTMKSNQGITFGAATILSGVLDLNLSFGQQCAHATTIKASLGCFVIKV